MIGPANDILDHFFFGFLEEFEFVPEDSEKIITKMLTSFFNVFLP